jgi:hypothetical protein
VNNVYSKQYHIKSKRKLEYLRNTRTVILLTGSRQCVVLLGLSIFYRNSSPPSSQLCPEDGSDMFIQNNVTFILFVHCLTTLSQ